MAFVDLGILFDELHFKTIKVIMSAWCIPDFLSIKMDFHDSVEGGGLASLFIQHWDGDEASFRVRGIKNVGEADRDGFASRGSGDDVAVAGCIYNLS